MLREQSANGICSLPVRGCFKDWRERKKGTQPKLVNLFEGPRIAHNPFSGRGAVLSSERAVVGQWNRNVTFMSITIYLDAPFSTKIL